jgi:hypothetical protein
MEMQEVITANRLADGSVVFLTADGGWTEDFHAAAVVADAQARANALEVAERAAAANHVVEPYAIELELRAGHLAPKALRETIRASGPTVRLDLGKQAHGQAPTIAKRG